MVNRIIAITLTLLGALVIAKATVSTPQRVELRQPLPLHCDSDGCRVILPDGTLSTGQVAKPEGYIETIRVGGCY